MQILLLELHDIFGRHFGYGGAILTCGKCTSFYLTGSLKVVRWGARLELHTFKGFCLDQYNRHDVHAKNKFELLAKLLNLGVIDIKQFSSPHSTVNGIWLLTA